MRRKEGAFTATLALTMTAVILLVSLPLTARISQTSTIASPSSSSSATTVSCSTQIPASDITDVYDTASGSTGLICVDYEFQTSGSYSIPPLDFGPLSVSSSGWSYEACGAPNGTNILICPGLEITPAPFEFDHQARELMAASFTVQTTEDASGLYLLFVADCDPIVLAIGAIPASVPSVTGMSCASSAPLPSVTVTGVSNINVVAVSSG